MDDETRAAIAALDEKTDARLVAMDGTMDAGFARMDVGFARMEHLFELQHAPHVELRTEVRQLSARVDALTERVGRLENEVVLLRDHTAREISEIRLDLRQLRLHSDQTAEIRRDIAQLGARVDRLERRQPD